MTTKAAKAWNELNERQQKYLETLYDVDQGLEAERRSEAARGRGWPPSATRRTPAWRTCPS